MSQLIENKIEELTALAKVEKDNNTQIVLLCLSGAKHAGLDGILAAKMQEFIKDVLMPETIRLQQEKIISQN